MILRVPRFFLIPSHLKEQYRNSPKISLMLDYCKFMLVTISLAPLIINALAFAYFQIFILGPML
jgi:hypothetical protein